MLNRYRQIYIYTKTENIYVDITKDVETRFNTSNYELRSKVKKRK